ncbi:MAG: hypothetical protein NXH78_13480 [Hyphomonadaceae bacterium]|nr:hypothetical protein [Hyphomonadaceae bacterium]
MATIFNLLKRNRWIEERYFDATDFSVKDTDADADAAFLSERGMILIACVLFCSFVWSAVFVWLFG